VNKETENKVVLFERGSIEAGVSLDPNEGIMHLLHHMTVGTKGARYLHKNIDERMAQLPNKYFMYLKRNKEIKGVFVSAQRLIQEDFGMANAYYIRYLAINEMFQTTKDKPVKHGNPDGMIKRLTKGFLSKAPVELGIGYGEDESLPSFHYAFFDAENFRSTDLSRLLGMEPIGTFSTFTFTRMNPKSFSNIEKLEKVHYHSMKERLNKQYADFSIYTDQYMFSGDNYFVWKEDGEIVAGVQPNKCEWEVKHMGGLAGVFMLKLLPFIPVLNKYFNPKKFEFITLDYIYVKPGHEDKLERLFENLLKEFNVNFSLIFQDLKSPFYSVFAEMDMGFISNFSKVPDGKIMLTHNKTTEEQRALMANKPVFTCGIDMS
jgi:hypothetical protein